MKTVRETGEFGLIARLLDALPDRVRDGGGLLVAAGDDAAVQTVASGESIVVTTDTLVEGVHFRLGWTDWTALGHKSLAVNLSDLAAMGARPLLATVSLGLRGHEWLEHLEDFYRGMGGLAARTGIRIAGGDVVRSPEAVTIGVTVVGETRGGRWLSRAGARPGDVVVVSGTLGASRAGLALLSLGEAGLKKQATTAALIEAHLRPEPRLALGELLLREGATAAMDLSDGLAGDLPKILAMSGVAARLRPGAIPIAAAVRALFPDETAEMALSGGEDYELVATVPVVRVDRVIEAAGAIGATLTAIGEIVEQTDDPARLTLVEADGSERPATEGAFDHFA